MDDSEVTQDQTESHINNNQDPAVAESQQPDQNRDTEPSVDVSSPASRPYDDDADEATRIASLAAGIRDQDDLERDIGRQADALLLEQADERDTKRLERTLAEKSRLDGQLTEFGNQATKNRYRAEIANYKTQIEGLQTDLDQIQARIEQRKDEVAKAGDTFLAEVMFDAEEEEDEDAAEKEVQADAQRSHRNLRMPGFAEDEKSEAEEEQEDFPEERPNKRRRLQSKTKGKGRADEDVELESAAEEEEDEYIPDMDDKELAAQAAETQEDLAGIDDGNEKVYQDRLQSWIRRRSAARRKHQKPTNPEDDATNVDMEQDDGEEHSAKQADEDEWHLPHPTQTDAEFEGGYRIPGDIYPSLFDYQKTGVQWLWELYSQQVGGIIGDEMGLGKTIQIISFIAGLHYSKKITKPIIIVCPATVMKQWVNEFHRWWPPLRVSILHTSGSGMLDVKREDKLEDDLDNFDYDGNPIKPSKGNKSAKRIVDKVQRDGHVLVTTYSGLQTYAEYLIPMEWEYCVLDEGHKIRNPNTAITIYSKEIRTHNRIILSGTPMQNNLTELWSLFDFVFPMRLGTLVSFKQQFETPIKQGGYANASNLQVDVASDLPKKSERVLFCKLTKPQRDAYEYFLNSGDMTAILNGKRQALYGIDILRKICNHPDLTEHKTLSIRADYNYGNPNKSGKMQVVKALLEIWKKNGHKTLLFAQHRIMLDILERFIREMGGINYLRMDGNTSIKDRQTLVDKFNKNPDLHVFLLTTKVGGLGVNLTGADRVIIYDPDWNPSTDVQARERAWRLGQKREVEIYRLMTAGTIEEKIYHRQIFKQFLTNKILRDPKQRQTFQLRDLHDLFTLGEASADGQTETGSIFKGTEVQLSGPKASDAETKTKEQEDAEATAR
ncbi:unnamed protein product [Aureobasidium pullulans]|nr:unnamed protein product [Aureobasidium pullulans]